MKREEIKEGVRFHDEKLGSKPVEYRVYTVKKWLPDGRFQAEHVASGHIRTFEGTPAALEGLRLIRPIFLLHNDLDALIGVKVRVYLVDGGNLGGRVTAIRYQTHDIAGVECRSVREIELDNSGATSYPIRDIQKIEKIDKV